MEDAVGDDDNKGTHAQADAHSNCGRYQGVGRALEHEHLHQVDTSRTHRPGHAHLGASSRRQHHENEEDQENANYDGEQSHDEEESGDEAADLVRLLQHLTLYVQHPVLRQVSEQGAYSRLQCQLALRSLSKIGSRQGGQHLLLHILVRQ